MTRAGEFEDLRPLLFAIAYRILGSVGEAEDAVQESWLRYESAAAEPASARAFLSAVVTRISIDVLRSARVRRETYVGQWLPEPLLTDPYEDPARSAELSDSLSMAALLLLERLSPLERAVFVLREVFDLAYGEIAAALGKTPAAVRQIAHRARAHVTARRPRGVVSRAETRDALAAFQRAAETGDLQQLADILAPDVVFLGDGGGIAQAVRTPIVGASRVARLLAVGLGRIPAAASIEPAEVNGYPALILRLNSAVDTVLAVRIDDGLITGLYAVRNPEKLSHMGQETTLRR